MQLAFETPIRSLPRRVAPRMIALTICLAASAFLGGCKPSDELSTPKKAGVAFAKAVQAGDMDAAHKAGIGSDADFAIVKSLSDLLLAEKRFEAAATKKFGKDGGLEKDDAMKDLVAEVEACEEKIDGDAATLVDKRNPLGAELSLKKDGGGWKVDVSAMGKDGGVAQMSKAGPQLVKALDDTARSIEAGKYPSAAEAKTALGQAIHDTLPAAK